jgi:hypothetical protein
MHSWKMLAARPFSVSPILGVSGGVLVGLFPGELKALAQHVYSDHRAERFVSAALGGGWSVRPNPHMAFFRRPSISVCTWSRPPISTSTYGCGKAPGWSESAATGRAIPRSLSGHGQRTRGARRLRMIGDEPR